MAAFGASNRTQFGEGAVRIIALFCKNLLEYKKMSVGATWNLAIPVR